MNKSFDLPITAVQVVIVRKKGDVEHLKSLDIPIRDDRNLDMILDAGDWGVAFHLVVPIDRQYTISHILRDQQAMEDSTTPLLPYVDGIYSERDLENAKAETAREYETKIDCLESMLKRRDKALRKLRREKAERKALHI